jgi:DNA-binding transcriptional regulator YdaS (Cro superfamily)
MKLTDWQKKKKVSNKELAEKVKIHVSLLTHMKNGRRRPSPDLALRIEKATGGAVSIRELLYPETK